MAVTVTSEERPKTRKRSYTLQLDPEWSDEKKGDVIEYTIKLKRIPSLARPNNVINDLGEYITWTWYETEFDF